jgi:hypothetical protein
MQAEQAYGDFYRADKSEFVAAHMPALLSETMVRHGSRVLARHAFGSAQDI